MADCMKGEGEQVSLTDIKWKIQFEQNIKHSCRPRQHHHHHGYHSRCRHLDASGSINLYPGTGRQAVGVITAGESIVAIW